MEVDGTLVHSKKNGDGYVDNEAKLNKIKQAIEAKLKWIFWTEQKRRCRRLILTRSYDDDVYKRWPTSSVVWSGLQMLWIEGNDRFRLGRRRVVFCPCGEWLSSVFLYSTYLCWFWLFYAIICSFYIWQTYSGGFLSFVFFVHGASFTSEVLCILVRSFKLKKYYFFWSIGFSSFSYMIFFDKATRWYALPR